MEENPFIASHDAELEEDLEDEIPKRGRSKSKSKASGAVDGSAFEDVADSPLGPASLERNKKLSECLDGALPEFLRRPCRNTLMGLRL